MAETFSNGGGNGTGRRNTGAGSLEALRAPNLMFPVADAFQERVDTGTKCSVRLSWRLRARPSATLHEIQICGEADWNISF